MNRLSKRSVVRLLQAELSMGAAEPQLSGQQISVAIRLELDINTVPKYGADIPR